MQQSRNTVQRSEIRALIAEFEAQYEAATRGLHGFAETAKHEMITARMERMGELCEELKERVGEQETMEIVVKAMDGKVVQ
jgi:hypothetical protein